MKRKDISLIKRQIVLLCCILASLGAMGQSNPLATGSWFKVGIQETGAYRISHDQLSTSALDWPIDQIKVLGNKGGMLPQFLGLDRPDSLNSIAFELEDNGDGVFNSGDYIILYGTGPDEWVSDADSSVIDNHITNLYSELNYIFIGDCQCTSTITPLDIDSSLIQQSATAIVDKGTYRGFHEREITNFLKSGRSWLGEEFAFDTVQIDVVAYAPIPSSELKTQFTVASSSTGNATEVDILINKSVEYTFSLQTSIASTYGTKGRTKTRDIDFQFSNQPSDTISFQIISNPLGDSTTEHFLDKIHYQYMGSLAYQEEQVIFEIPETQQTATQLTFDTDMPGLRLWSISSENQIVQWNQKQGQIGQFNVGLGTSRFLLFHESDLMSPSSVEALSNQDVKSTNSADMLLICSRDEIDLAQEYVSWKASIDTLTISIATIEDIYNEFSSGRQDVSALRDFVKHIYQKSSEQLKYLLLFGAGSYDYNGYDYPNSSKVPVYQSYQSFQNVQTYSSDDFFGILDDNEGDWVELNSIDEDMEVAIGRVPFRTREEAENWIEKMQISHEIKNYGPWMNRSSFVADDGDLFLHLDQAESYAETFDNLEPEFNIKKLYLSAHAQWWLTSTQQYSPDLERAIIDNANEGTLFYTYSGHGSKIQFGWENYWNDSLQQFWDNEGHYPIILSMTCDAAVNDNPSVAPLLPELMFQKLTGVTTVVGASRPVYASVNFATALSFFLNVLQWQDQPARLGDIWKKTKNNSSNGIFVRNMMILGDPSVKLPLKERTIQTTAITEKPDNFGVGLQGSITEDGTLDSEYNGTVWLTALRAPIQDETFEEGGNTYEFNTQDDVLFQIETQVVNGEFTFLTRPEVDLTDTLYTVKYTLFSVDTSTGSIGKSVLTEDFFQDSFENDAPAVTWESNTTPIVTQDTVLQGNSLSMNIDDASAVFLEEEFTIQGLTIEVDGLDLSGLMTDYVTNSTDPHEGMYDFDLSSIDTGWHEISFSICDIHVNCTESIFEFYYQDSTTVIGGIEDIAIGHQIEIFPNPAQSGLSSYFKVPQQVPYISYELIGLQGNVIYTSPVIYNSGLININQSGEALNEGSYVLRTRIYDLSKTLRQEYSSLFLVEK